MAQLKFRGKLERNPYITRNDRGEVNSYITFLDFDQGGSIKLSFLGDLSELRFDHLYEVTAVVSQSVTKQKLGDQSLNVISQKIVDNPQIRDLGSLDMLLRMAASSVAKQPAAS